MNPSGLLWFGPITEVGGFGTVSRNYLKSLSNAPFPIQTINLAKPDFFFSEQEKAYFGKLAEPKNLGENVVAIFNVTPDAYLHLIDLYPVKKKIGMFCFETDRIPRSWVAPANLMDEIWVPSQFNYQTFSDSGIIKDKIKIVPYTLDTDFYANFTKSSLPFKNPVKSFKFIFNGSFDYRKGFDYLIQSYCDTFTDKDDVILIIKTFKPSWMQQQNPLDVLHSYIPKRKNIPQIEFLVDKLSERDLLNLYAHCDAYVSAERANGWGYPPMEMMAMGKPVIHLNWGGNTEFMTQENAFLYNPEGDWEPVSKFLQLYRPKNYAGHKWVTVSTQKIQEQMRLVFENPSLRKEKSLQGQLDILKKFNYSTISALLLDSL